MAANSHSFGPFTLDSSGTLSRDGKPVAIGQRALALLAALVDADGAASKATLMEAVWPGQIVEDGNLTVQIAALRKALGRRPDGSEWIVTVPRVGYRLIRADGTARLQRSTIPTIALVPFQTIGRGGEQVALAEGIAEDLTTALSRFRTIRVTGRGPDDADYIVQGSVRAIADRLRINVQLVNGTGGTHLWANAFDGTLATIADLQDRITASIAAAVELEIRRTEEERASRERTGSDDPRDLYLRAMAKLGTYMPGPSAEGLALIERVIAIDPDRHEAVAMAAWAYEHRLHMGWPPVGPDDMGRCLALARRALAATRDDARVIAHCGIILQQCGQEWDQGLRVIERAIALNPADTPSLFFGGVGNLKAGTLELAQSFFERLTAIDPNDDGALCGIGHAKLCGGHYEEALDCGTRALAINPRFGWIHWLVICANAYLGRMDEAEKALGVYRDLFPDARLERIVLGNQMRDPQRAEVVFRGLRMAGMP